jgi:hypothetical protein
MDNVTCPLFRRSFTYTSLSSAAEIVEAAATQSAFSARPGPLVLSEFPEFDDLWDLDNGIMPEVSIHTTDHILTAQPHAISEDIQSNNDTEFDGSQNHQFPAAI